MNKKIKLYIYITVLLYLCPQIARSQEQEQAIVLDEIIVSSKEGQELRKIPTSVSILSSTDVEKGNISDIRDLTAIIPNMFIPDYGSKYTSAIYIRGVGSRLGNAAIGMYVDNVPYLDKTAFDFDFFDIKRIEALRGPQGTLYGRNSMAGLINIYTLSPWDYQGTNIKLASGNYGHTKMQLSHYAKIREKFAFSIGGNYSATGGFLKNQNPDYKPEYSNVAGVLFPSSYKDNSVEATQSASLRANASWRLSEKLSFNYIGSYEYTDQNGYAYGEYNPVTNLPDTINYNDPAYYRRNVLNNSLRIEYQTKNLKITSTTGHQLLNDSLLLDQDFSAASMFTLFQSQKLNTINEEVTIRSTGTSNFQWVGGISGFIQNLNTESLVTFKKDGIAFIQDNINNSGSPPLTITNKTIPIVGEYITKNHGLAAFLQPTINNFLIKGMSVSAGVRLDYENVSLEHFTNSAFDCSIQMGPTTLPPYSQKDTIVGNEKMDFTQLLPKFSVRYENNGNILYASISKGYKAGGYNLQMFSDLIESKMRTTRPVEFDIQKSTSFKPEYSWNYEVGARISMLKNKMNLGITLFQLNINDQQITEFAPNGQGRMIKNAGKSQSKGIELDADIHPFSCLRIGLGYGYTESKFTEYMEQIAVNSFIDYSGKYVPFVPRQTAYFGATYIVNFENSFIDRILINGRYSGAGKIYWTEANDVSQKFYSVLNGKLSLERGDFALSIWGENLLNSKYSTFYFKTFGNAFGQLGKPIRFGVELSVKLN
ncbi:MAG: TonB-dependent receptor [Prevotellaceae bacterium]|jgi:outer membrane receptor protein involved in Fe transport|nr:TonB-dependent receptor [Prevotellaceae bacterium]